MGGGGLANLTALQQSMLLLAESLDSGAIGGQFEQLYRRNQSLAITECHLLANAAKNRWVKKDAVTGNIEHLFGLP